MSSHSFFPDEVEKLIASGAETDFQLLLSNAKFSFRQPYYHCMPYSIAALVHFSTTPERIELIIETVLEGMHTALYLDNEDGEPSTGANNISFAAGAIVLGKISNLSVEDKLIEYYNKACNASFELVEAAAFIAIALACLGSQKAIQILEAEVGKRTSYKMSSRHVALTYYALWVLKKDKNAAKEYLLGTHDTTGFSGITKGDWGNRIYAAAALADMQASELINDIEKGIDQRDSLFLRQVMREAVRRLCSTEPLSPSNQLIWHLGLLLSLGPSDIEYEKEEALAGIECDPRDTLQFIIDREALLVSDQRILWPYIASFIEEYDIEKLKAFSIEKVDFSFQDARYKETLLHKAVNQYYPNSKQSEEVLIFILKNTNDLNIVDNYDETPLHTLFKKEHLTMGIITALVNKEISLSLCNDNDESLELLMTKWSSNNIESSPQVANLIKDLLNKS